MSGIQCVDLIKMYLDKVYGIKAGSWGNAKDYFEKFNYRTQLIDNFIRIKNTADFVPRKGDIVVWGTGLGNQYGHIAIASGEGNTHQFYSYDLNWGQKIVHKVLHNYKGFLGVLRPINQDLINENNKKFSIGVVYTSQVNLYVRKEAGLNKDKVLFEELTANAKKHAYKDKDGFGILNAKTDMTCLAVKNVGENIWIKIPSGWVCAIFQGKEYIK